MQTLNSKTSPIMLARVIPENEQGGWVAITLSPGKKTQGTFNFWNRDLQEDLDRLRKLEATVLVPLLTDAELVRFKIPDLVEAAEGKGLSVDRYPIIDGGIPDDLEGFGEFVRKICRQFRKGERVVAHCNGGLGRAGTFAASMRLAVGLDSNAKDAITMGVSLKPSWVGIITFPCSVRGRNGIRY